MTNEILNYAIELDETRKLLEKKRLFIGMNSERGLEIRAVGKEGGYRITKEEAKMLQDNLSKQISEISGKIKGL